MNEDFQKELTKKYSKVVKKDIQVKEGLEKLEGTYEKEKNSNANKLKEDLKQFRSIDKDIKDTHKASEKDIKLDNKDQLAGIAVKIKETEKKHSDLEAKSVLKCEKEIARLEKAKEKLHADYEKLVQKEQEQFDKDVAANKKEQEKIVREGQKTLDELQETYDEKQAKHKEKILAIEEKREAKIEKLSSSSEKTIEKLEDGNTKQREKVDKQLQDNTPIFEEKLSEIESLINKEQSDYEKQLSDINETLNSKLERRNKFLEKAENENDTKAAKIQRKEIKQLGQSADREIKALEKGHTDRKTDLEMKKHEVLKNNLDQIASIEREFVNFKEDNLMQIEINKVTLSDQITKTKLDTELQLQDELNKFNEFVEKHTIKVAKAIEKTKLEEEEIKDLLVKRTIEFDKTNEHNKLLLDEQLALNLKDQQITELQKVNEIAINQVELEIALAKLAYDKEVEEAKAHQLEVLNTHDSLIKYHESDNKKQASVKSEFKDNQEALIKLYSKRAEEISEFEELEILNRVALKEEFLNTQGKRVKKDLQALLRDIELAFNQEEELYNKEIKKIADEDQKAILDYKHSEEEEIQALVDEKKECNPKIDKARIMELDRELDVKKQVYREQLKQKEDALYTKTQLFQENIELAKARRAQAEVEAKEMTELELNDIAASLELLHNNKEAEQQEVRSRYDKTIKNLTNFKNLIINRNQQTTEENLAYTNNRVQKENQSKEEIVSSFENLRLQSNSKLQSAIEQQEKLRVSNNEALKNNAASREKELEATLETLKQSKLASNKKEEERLQAQRTALSNSKTKINQEADKKELDAQNILKQQQNKNVQDVQGIDKKQDVENKTFESEKVRVKKEYEIELKKGLDSINTKLAVDIKELK